MRSTKRIPEALYPLIMERKLRGHTAQEIHTWLTKEQDVYCSITTLNQLLVNLSKDRAIVAVASYKQEIALSAENDARVSTKMLLKLEDLLDECFASRDVHGVSKLTSSLVHLLNYRAKINGVEDKTVNINLAPEQIEKVKNDLLEKVFKVTGDKIIDTDAEVKSGEN